MVQLVFTLASLTLALFAQISMCSMFIMWISVTIQMSIWIHTHLFCTMTKVKLKCLAEITSGNSKKHIYEHTYPIFEYTNSICTHCTAQHIFVNVFKTANKTNMTDIKRSCCSFVVLPNKQRQNENEEEEEENHKRTLWKSALYWNAIGMKERVVK